MSTPPDRLLRRLEWQLTRRLDGTLQGAHRTVMRGSGTDLAGLRPYLDQDDVRHVDWNVTARLGEPHVRLYHEDRDLTAWLVLDRTASMRFGRDDRAKDAVLTDVALTLARVLTLGGDRVGALLDDGQRARVVPPGTGRAHVLRIGRALDAGGDPRVDGGLAPARARARRGLARLRGGRDAEPVRTGTDLAAILVRAARTIPRRSLVVLVSDFLGEPGWERSLTQLTHRHAVVAVRVVDPTEREVPDVGVMVVEDAETGEQVLLDTGDPLFRARLAVEVDRREAELAAVLRQAGVPLHVVSTADDLMPAVVDVVRGPGQAAS